MFPFYAAFRGYPSPSYLVVAWPAASRMHKEQFQRKHSFPRSREAGMLVYIPISKLGKLVCLSEIVLCMDFCGYDNRLAEKPIGRTIVTFIFTLSYCNI